MHMTMDMNNSYIDIFVLI